ncbi:hypothetical protein TSAR_012374 [Trichomalopsis sarcophagae]|uniref:Uncharacterized protein n=1 Tax=Trichomalopsis sarcophagae TaxID=543379 RepID=A0A232ENH3_9HYME|nr:hypothetical protein TSAR_012374 [Trichomalopsis sarcophagae]
MAQHSWNFPAHTRVYLCIYKRERKFSSSSPRVGRCLAYQRKEARSPPRR